MNPSLSMTLSACHTITRVSFELGESAETNVEFRFHGKENEKFLPKINTFMERVSHLYPFVGNLKSLVIESENSFPHSSGIASSASAFAAMALAFEHIQSGLDQEEQNLSRAGEAARLGSGSACRSLHSGFSTWGKLSEKLGSDQFAQELDSVHPVFDGALNAILIVSSKEKSVGSTLGHSLMQGHPFAQARLAQANENCRLAIEYISEGKVWELGEIIENEAMTLHALMMTSSPSFMLMEPQTLAVIEKVRSFRKETNIPVFFTLDAGPNPHLFYLKGDKEQVEEKLLPSLASYCEQGRIIMDQRGEGAKCLESHFE